MASLRWQQGAVFSRPCARVHQQRQASAQQHVLVQCVWRTAAWRCWQLFGGECSNCGAAVIVCGVVGDGMRDHERVVVGLVCVRRVVVQCVRLAVGRVVEQGCRGGAHHDHTVGFKYRPS